MALSENDLLLIRYAGISERDFEKMSEKEQDKALSDGFKKYKKKRKLSNPEYLGNAKEAVPKIRELLQKPPIVYYRKTVVSEKTKTSKVDYLQCQIIGYSASEKEYLAISPNSKPGKSGKKNVIRIAENDVIKSVDEMK